MIIIWSLERHRSIVGAFNICVRFCYVAFVLLISISTFNAKAAEILIMSVDNICSTDINDAIRASKILLSKQLVTYVEAHIISKTSIETTGQAELIIQVMNDEIETHSSARLLDYRHVANKKSKDDEICIDATARGDVQKIIADIELRSSIIKDLTTVGPFVRAREISKEEFYRYDRKPRRIE